MNNSELAIGMIEVDGTLRVRLPAEEVSWFDFMYFSRATNSTHGGWDMKSHWRERGLQPLIDDNATFLPQWTKNSLQESGNYLPTPRKSGFMFKREESERRSGLMFKTVGTSSENELNYALFMKLLPGVPEVELLDYETPLCGDSEGQLKADLFGVSDNGKVLEIIELKKANNHGDSPLFALTEAFCYALQTLRCGKALWKEFEQAHPGRLSESFDRIGLTLLAPAEYWSYWCDGSDQPGALEGELQKIVAQVNAGIASNSVYRATLTLRCRAL
ncbi:MAG TPA: hypothetical protein VGO11_15800 [Chthoniobacteraceae bacterium]|jgi:hypothetical protein|nr:hypothetical protein [Chthoniobacteraceae bacterium]